ncbi:hypothetical protein ACH5RR_036500 [Cinchona calisaya]|uniref:Uncharacterized protein n=1 Tax=Cinchona calisaya TaxID=153742 RepID=A0ABD2Y4U3_9GENT
MGTNEVQLYLPYEVMSYLDKGALPKPVPGVRTLATGIRDLGGDDEEESVIAEGPSLRLAASLVLFLVTRSGSGSVGWIARVTSPACLSCELVAPVRFKVSEAE